MNAVQRYLPTSAGEAIITRRLRGRRRELAVAVVGLGVFFLDAGPAAAFTLVCRGA